ncbi:MAG: glucose-1-phosphate adenylyltransferase [Bacilli bacterium]
MEKELVAMLLAGGKGTRLETLTKKIAKPAVSFGGKYRIIDFPLSNCANSGIDTVGVLTQYESILLNTYIGNGEKWGLNGIHSLTATLPPRQTEEGNVWYKGTADAIYQNIDFLDNLKPSYVLILSGDHIYRMNYQTMLDAHKKSHADLTVAVINVDKKEASRFGIMSVDKDNFVTQFDEKPTQPKSTLASMGIYIFNYKELRLALMNDAKDETSEHDFGKNIIPSLLKQKRKILAFPFEGYWRDVGTIESLWEANMDLLDREEAKSLLQNDDLKLFTEDTRSLPQYLGEKAKIKNALINQGAVIFGSVDHSVIFHDVLIEEGASVIDSVIMPGAIIKSGCVLKRVIVSPKIKVETSVNGGANIALVNK